MIERDAAQLLANKICLVLSAINKQSSPEQDRYSSEALLNLLNAMILLDKMSTMEVKEDAEAKG